MTIHHACYSRLPSLARFCAISSQNLWGDCFHKIILKNFNHTVVQLEAIFYSTPGEMVDDLKHFILKYWQNSSFDSCQYGPIVTNCLGGKNLSYKGFVQDWRDGPA